MLQWNQVDSNGPLYCDWNSDFFFRSFFLSSFSESSILQTKNLFKSISDRTKAILAKALSVGASEASEPESPSAFNRIFGTIKDRLEESQFKRQVLDSKWYLKSRRCFSGQSVAEQYALHKWQWENCPMRQRWVWNLKLEAIPEVDEELFEEDEEELEDSEEAPDATYCAKPQRVGGSTYFRRRLDTVKALISHCRIHLRESSASHNDSSTANNVISSEPSHVATADIAASTADCADSSVRTKKAQRVSRSRTIRCIKRLPAQIKRALWA